jgi:hypothetical protein
MVVNFYGSYLCYVNVLKLFLFCSVRIFVARHFFAAELAPTYGGSGCRGSPVKFWVFSLQKIFKFFVIFKNF